MCAMRFIATFLFSFVLLTGCSPGGERLPTTRVVIDAGSGPAAFTVEIAADEASQQRGLMFRTELAPDAGMLFDFHKPSPRSFWMKNTLISLDMIFIRADGTIANVATNTIPYSEDPILSSEPVLAVLEIKGGRAAELGIEPGQTVHAKIFGNAN
jgi:uncharacterized protein